MKKALALILSLVVVAMLVPVGVLSPSASTDIESSQPIENPYADIAQIYHDCGDENTLVSSNSEILSCVQEKGSITLKVRLGAWDYIQFSQGVTDIINSSTGSLQVNLENHELGATHTTTDPYNDPYFLPYRECNFSVGLTENANYMVNTVDAFWQLKADKLYVPNHTHSGNAIHTGAGLVTDMWCLFTTNVPGMPTRGVAFSFDFTTDADGYLLMKSKVTNESQFGSSNTTTTYKPAEGAEMYVRLTSYKEQVYNIRLNSADIPAPKMSGVHIYRDSIGGGTTPSSNSKVLSYEQVDGKITVKVQLDAWDYVQFATPVTDIIHSCDVADYDTLQVNLGEHELGTTLAAPNNDTTNTYWNEYRNAHFFVSLTDNPDYTVRAVDAYWQIKGGSLYSGNVSGWENAMFVKAGRLPALYTDSNKGYFSRNGSQSFQTRGVAFPFNFETDKDGYLMMDSVNDVANKFSVIGNNDTEKKANYDQFVTMKDIDDVFHSLGNGTDAECYDYSYQPAANTPMYVRITSIKAAVYNICLNSRDIEAVEDAGADVPGPEPDENEPKTLYVQDFGAKGDGVTDDALAILQAMNALRSSPAGSVLEFEAGKTYYYKDNGTVLNYLFFFNGNKDLTVKGNGCLVKLGGYDSSYARILNSENITIEGFNLDYDGIYKPAFAATLDGTFEFDNENNVASVIVKADRAIGLQNGETYTAPRREVFGTMPTPTTQYYFWIDKYEMVDADQNKVKVYFDNTKGQNWCYSNTELIERYGLVLPMPYNGFANGDTTGRSDVSFDLRNNTTLTFRDINVYSSKYQNFFLKECDGTVTFDSVNYVRAPYDQDLPFISWGDIYHPVHCRAKFIWKDCVAETPYDDVFNIIGGTMYVSEKHSDTEATLSVVAGGSFYGVPVVRVGDTISIVDSETKGIIGTPIVKEVVLQEDSKVRVIFEQSIDGLTAGTNILAWDEDAVCDPASEMINCTMDGQFRARSNMTFTDCDFYVRTFRIGLEVPQEGPVPHDLLFRGCNLEKGCDGDTVWYINSYNGSNPDGYHTENIVFEDCTGIVDSQIEKSTYDEYTIRNATPAFEVEDVKVADGDEFVNDTRGFGVLGSQVRTTDNSLRFVARISQALIDQLSEDGGEVKEYGIALVSENYFGANGGGNGKTALELDGSNTTFVNKNTVAKVKAEKIYKDFEDYNNYTAVITGLQSERQMSTRFCARAYVIYTDADGVEHTYYATEDDNDAGAGNYKTGYGAYWKSFNQAMADLQASKDNNIEAEGDENI